MLCRNGSSLVPLFASPESKQTRKDTDYGQNQKTNITEKNHKNVTQRREKFKKNLGCLPRSTMFNVVSSTALNLNVLGDRALMIAYYTSSDAVKGMICLSARNSPPKYGFNRWVVTVNVPFSGCVTSAPPPPPPHVKRPWLQ